MPKKIRNLFPPPDALRRGCRAEGRATGGLPAARAVAVRLTAWRRTPLLLLAAAVLALSGCTEQAKRQRHFERAERFFRAQAYEKAELEYMNFLRLGGTNKVAVQRLAHIYFAEGAGPKALYFLLQAVAMDTNDLALRLDLGQACLGARQWKRAREEALFILSKEPAHEDALVLLADASTATVEIEDARRRLEALRPQAGTNAGYHVAVGSLFLRQTNLAAAGAAFQQALAINSNNVAAHLALGTLAQSSNDLARAEHHFKTAASLSPLRSSRRLRYVDFKIQTGDTAGAKALLQDLVKQAPGYGPALQRLAEVALAERQFDECAQWLARILARDPTHYEARLLGARLKLARGDPAKAATDLEQMCRAFPRNPEPPYQLAVAYLASGDLGRAAGALNQVLALDTNHVEAILLLSDLSVRLGNPPQTISLLNGLLQRRPQTAQAYLTLANAYRLQRNFDEALAVYRRMARVFPSNAQPHLLTGLLLDELNRPAEARAALEKGLSIAPENLVLIERLVDRDLRDKQFAAAAQRLQPVLAKKPNAPEPLVLLARIQAAQGQTDQAEATLKKIIESAPNLAGPYLALADLYLSTRRTAQALEKLEAAVAVTPQDYRSQMLVGLLREQLGNFKGARDAYQQALAANPRFGPALNNLVVVLSERLGELDKAYELANKNKETLLQAAEGKDTLGWVLFKRGEYPWALSLLRESAAQLLSNPEAQFHLGMVHYMMGDEDGARAAFQRALQSGRDFASKAETSQRLAFLNLDAKTASADLIAALEQRLAEQPGDPVAISRLAAIHERNGAFDKVVQSYEQALKANPKAVPLMLKLAQVQAERLGDLKKAIELAKAARALAPADPAIAHLLGRLTLRSADPKWALSLLQEAAPKLPGRPDVLYDLARAQYANGRVAEAEASIRAALDSGVAFAGAEAARQFLAWSTLYTDPVKARAAAPQLQAVLQKEPDHLPALMAVGVLHEQARDTAAARQTYERILTQAPTFSPAMRQLALLPAATPAEEKRAYELGVRAREAFPQDTDLARSLGLLAYKRADHLRAAQLLKEVARARPTDAEVFFHLGMTHHQLKAKKEAADALRQALALNLPASLAEQARKTLDALK